MVAGTFDRKLVVRWRMESFVTILKQELPARESSQSRQVRHKKKELDLLILVLLEVFRAGGRTHALRKQE